MRIITICSEDSVQHHQYSGYSQLPTELKMQMARDMDLFLKVNGIHRVEMQPQEKEYNTIEEIDAEMNNLLEKRKLLQLVS